MAIKCSYYGDQVPPFEDDNHKVKHSKNVVADSTNVQDIESVRLIDTLDDESIKIEFSLLSAQEYLDNIESTGAFAVTKYVDDIIKSLLDTNAYYFWTSDIAEEDSNRSKVLYVNNHLRCIPYFEIRDKIEQSFFVFKPVINTSKKYIEALKSRGCISNDGNDIVQFGYYPTSEDKKVTKKIIKFINDSIFRDRDIKYDHYSIAYSHNEVYVVDGKKYVYFYDYKKAYKIEPIDWIIDYKNNRLISYYGLFTGLTFNLSSKTYSSFEESPIYNYLNDDFAKNLLFYENLELPYIIEKKTVKKVKEDNKVVSSNNKISITNDLNLFSEIEYNLSVLKDLNKEKYEELNKRYNDCINNNCTEISVLGRLSGEILAEIAVCKKEIDMFNFFEKEKERCIDNFLNGTNNDLTIEKLDNIFVSFISRNKGYDVKTRIKILKDISLLYLIELYKSKDSINIYMLSNTYVSFHIKNIVLWIRELISKDIIECHYYVNYIDEITIDELIMIIKSIEVINAKKIQFKA